MKTKTPDLFIVFDLDDTLYDRAVPFLQALEHVMALPVLDHPRNCYLTYCHCSQEMFELHEKGHISLEESRIRRIQNTAKMYRQTLTENEARAFQKYYQEYQSQISLSAVITSMLEQLQQTGVPMGILTNGPDKHQRNKVRALGLEKYIPEEYILTSEQLGYAKPAPQSFALVIERLHLTPETTWMIGDSLKSDILGARQAGWNTLWFDRETMSEQTLSEHVLQLLQ